MMRDTIFKMILPYNFINKSVFEYLREIDHFFVATTVVLATRRYVAWLFLF